MHTVAWSTAGIIPPDSTACFSLCVCVCVCVLTSVQHEHELHVCVLFDMYPHHVHSYCTSAFPLLSKRTRLPWNERGRLFLASFLSARNPEPWWRGGAWSRARTNRLNFCPDICMGWGARGQGGVMPGRTTDERRDECMGQQRAEREEKGWTEWDTLCLGQEIWTRFTHVISWPCLVSRCGPMAVLLMCVALCITNAFTITWLWVLCIFFYKMKKALFIPCTCISTSLYSLIITGLLRQITTAVLVDIRDPSQQFIKFYFFVMIFFSSPHSRYSKEEQSR